MTIIETTKMTSKGQVTIPLSVRKILGLQQGTSVAFSVTKNGIMLLPCEVTAQSPYTSKEWEKIEKMVCEKGAVYATGEAAKKRLASL
ncbi:MAG: AbrB/MazE/SpoVT family DNA-binding domain-containing protein [Candidatus Omnitrophota bacterium]